jgi:signal transduction histidine kinase
MSLRTKLTLTHTLVAIVGIAIFAVALNAGLTAAFRRLSAEQALETARNLAPLFGQLYERQGSWEGVQRVAVKRPALLSRLGRQRVLIADAAGRIVADSRGGAALGQQLTAAQRALAVPIEAGGRTVGSVVVMPTISQLGDIEDRFTGNINRLFLLTSVIAAAIAALVGLVLAAGLTRPLKALTRAAQRLAQPGARAGGGAPALPVASRDEVGRLTAAFNQMAAELASQEAQRRQLVADIAHELRTPISVLRMDLEGIEDGVVQPSPAVLASLQEEVGLLSRLVDDLRLLSLTDAGQLALTPGPVAPAAAVERVATLSAARARQRGIELRTELAPGLPAAWADEQRLVQILGNLIENALRYTPQGGIVTLGARAGSDGGRRVVIFEVRDTGPGIPPEELERIFDRFYRADRARARETGGSGLGLAIVRGLAEAMGGRVWAESPPGQGARFFVALPTDDEGRRTKANYTCAEGAQIFDGLL